MAANPKLCVISPDVCLSTSTSNIISSELELEETTAITNNSLDSQPNNVDALCTEIQHVLASADVASSFPDLCKPGEVGKEFTSLPEEMKLQIFSYLSPSERGQIASVCTEWKELTQDSSLWSVIDLTTFLLPHPSPAHFTLPYPFSVSTLFSHQTNPGNRVINIYGVPGSAQGDGVAYAAYRSRVCAYLYHLRTTVHPLLRVLRIAFDIGDTKDRWMEMIVEFLNGSQLRLLHTVLFVWNRTPARQLLSPPSSLDLSSSSSDVVSLGEAGKNDVEEDDDELSVSSVEGVYKLRQTQRRFVSLFDKLTSLAANIQRLSLPFDWSNRSLDLLCRLAHLHTLVIHRYSLCARVTTSTISRLLTALPNLHRFSLELWLSSGTGLTLLQFNSQSLRYLDISRCRGVYVDKLNLPLATVVKLSRRPRNYCRLAQPSSPNCTGQAGHHTRAAVGDDSESRGNRDRCPPEGGGKELQGGAGGEETGDVRRGACVKKTTPCCIFEILRQGTPNLRQLNELTLNTDWLSLISCYDDLDLVLTTLCLCKYHVALANEGWQV